MRIFVKILLSVFFVLLSLNVQAATFNFNYSSTSTLFVANDGTQTEWLHLSENDHMNFSQVSAALITNADWAGYQVATMNMVGQVTQELFGFNWATLPFGYYSTSTDYDEYCIAAVSFFGKTYEYSTYPNYIWGYVADTDNSQPNKRWTMALTDNNFTGHRNDGFEWKTLEDVNLNNPQIGTFLVREVSSVPIPSTISLLGFGLLGLARISRKKK